ncbi:MAG: anhydro-N-acetylmuramic acid kinase [Sphingobacteriaceae bacterium]|nr:anhydro-N-acetylmuramic acid kinase [Sphingobacteriaceae bacterium]
MSKSRNLKVLGIMSGTSLDGLDLALCEFNLENDLYVYKVLKANTLTYSKEQRKKLEEIKNGNAQQYLAMNHLYGKYIGLEVKKFIEECGIKPDLISSHGHTIYHQPQHGFSAQLGCGATIAAISKTTTVCDFRILDVVNGGQGAPLVPIGDKLLFSDYDACLNLGGIANISFEFEEERKAFDICFLNMALNYLAEKLGKAFDEDGKLADAGKTDEFLLKELKETLHIDKKISLARERYENLLLPILGNYRITIEDKLATFCEYAAEAIAEILNEFKLKKVLLTGGGTYNQHVLKLLKQKYKGELVIPDHETIQFKEAIIFGFLGYLRVNEKINTLKTVTGAVSNSVGGAVYYFNEEF